jgi:triosephosphate isomerase
VIGVSLKMYLGYEETLAWCERVRRIALSDRSVTGGGVELFVIPSFPALFSAGQILAGAQISLGAQNLHWEDTGPFTGEVSGSMLAELGCRFVEVGHAERRRLFGENDEVVGAKTAAALRNGLVPIVCVGEIVHSSKEESLQFCVSQLRKALRRAAPKATSRVIVAYEPVWAIGASAPAPATHIAEMCSGLRAALRSETGVRSSVIYGGAAGPGLLSQLHKSVDGLFLGRSVHDPAALAGVLEEAALLSARARAGGGNAESPPRPCGRGGLSLS